MPEIYFKEKQKFSQWWIIMILAVVSIIWIWGVIQQILMGVPFGKNPPSDLGLLLIGLIVAIPIVLFFISKLETQVKNDGLYYKMIPFFRFRKISRDEIRLWHIRKYKPLEEYGGWGIRFSLHKGGGWAYNVSGNTGLQLELSSGKKILIGSQEPQELKRAMMKFAPEKAKKHPKF